MKKLVCGAMLVLASAGAVADEVRLVSADESPFTHMCLAATKSWVALEQVIAEADVANLSLEEVECNGKPLMQFAREHARAANDEARQLSMLTSTAFVKHDLR